MQFENASQAVAVAIRAIFKRWAALRLVVEHQFGGSDTHSGVNELLDKTVALATDPSKRHDFDAYLHIFYNAFANMNTDLEDGSPEDVAHAVLEIRDAAARGDFRPAIAAAERAGISEQAFQKSVCGTRDSDEEDEKDTQQAPPPPLRQPVVDDDGFTQVVSKRHR